MESDNLYGDCMVNALSVSLDKYFVSIICRNYVDSMETVWRVIPFYGDCMVNALSGSRHKYFISIICRNCVDSMETVWRVVLYMEILW